MVKYLVPAALVFAAGNASADECDSVKDVAARAEKALGKVCQYAGAKIDCSKVEKVKAKVDEAIKAWNDVMGDTKLTIGPRPITPGESEDGKLVAGGQRTFISTLALDGSYEIKVKKTGGKAADIAVCAIDGKGAVKKVANLDFGKETDGTRGKVVKLNGEVLVVRLDAMGAQSFAYTVNLSEKK